MARAPTRVTKTMGQGVSRRAYQVSRGLGMTGTGVPGGTLKSYAMPETSPGITGTGKRSSRVYTKAETMGGPMNIAYSEREFKTPNLDALKAIGNMTPPKKGIF